MCKPILGQDTTLNYNSIHDTTKATYEKGTHTHKVIKKKDKAVYDLPNVDFSKETYWTTGDFYYKNATKRTFGLEATRVTGYTIFWKKNKNLIMKKSAFILFILLTFNMNILAQSSKSYTTVYILNKIIDMGEYVNDERINKNQEINTSRLIYTYNFKKDSITYYDFYGSEINTKKNAFFMLSYKKKRYFIIEFQKKYLRK